MLGQEAIMLEATITKPTLMLPEYVPAAHYQIGSFKDIGTWRAQILLADDCLARDDIAGIERSLFSHNGLKNALHMAVRKERAGASFRNDMRDLFGDLELADQLLSGITGSPYETETQADDAEPVMVP